MRRIWLAAILLCSVLGTAAAETKRVLVLHSFGREFKPWSDYARLIRTELDRQSQWPLDFQEYSIATARTSDQHPEVPFVEYLRALFARQPPDLIVTLGAPAAAFVQRHRQQLFSRSPMVMTAVEQRRIDHAALTENDAAVAVWINYRAAVENILHVLPNTNHIAVVLGASPLEQFWKAAIGKELAPLANRISLTWYSDLSFEQILKHAAALPPNSAIFWELMLVDAAGVVHEGDTAMARLRAVANAPIFSYDEVYFGRGIVGGPLLSIPDISRQTAAVAVRMLGGETGSTIKMPPVPFAAPKFDWRELQRWNISAHNLPPGSSIHFRTPTFWEQYHWYLLAIAAIVVLQTGLIAGLLYQESRRRRAEARATALTSELIHLNRVATAGQISASIAHEMRQPLTAIVAFSEAALIWLNNKVPNLDEVRDSLQSIVGQSHRADQVIRTVRALFRQEAEPKARLNINDLIEQVTTLVKQDVISHRIVLETDLAKGAALEVYGNSIQLQQVILNLLLNAIEAMSGSESWTRILRIKTESGRTRKALITISDTGPGIDPRLDDQDFIAPFFTTKPGGMGMGLSLCRSIIGEHGGEFAISRGTPGGTIVQITLPPATMIDS